MNFCNKTKQKVCSLSFQYCRYLMKAGLDLQVRCPHSSSIQMHNFFSSVKEEPEETEIKKLEATFKPPPLPEPEVLPDLLHRWSLSKGEELFFMQLPDSLPGQPPTIEHRPVKTEVQSEDGQSVLLKTESQVDVAVVYSSNKWWDQCCVCVCVCKRHF